MNSDRRNVIAKSDYCQEGNLLTILGTVFGNSLAPIRFLTPFFIRSSRRLRNSLRSDILDALLRRVPCAWRGLYGEKTVREGERAWFLSGGEESEALIRVAFDTLGQKQRVLKPWGLSLSSRSLWLFPKTHA
jgi:hypothetical protein